MAKSISEVMLGTGELYIGAETTAFPTDPTTTPSSSDWTDIGYSESGWTLDYDKTFEDVIVKIGIPQRLVMASKERGRHQERPFSSLMRTIIYQQVAGSAAASMEKKVLACLGVTEHPQAMKFIPLQPAFTKSAN
mgnify:CR=1 FL=1